MAKHNRVPAVPTTHSNRGFVGVFVVLDVGEWHLLRLERASPNSASSNSIVTSSPVRTLVSSSSSCAIHLWAAHGSRPRIFPSHALPLRHFRRRARPGANGPGRIATRSRDRPSGQGRRRRGDGNRRGPEDCARSPRASGSTTCGTPVPPSSSPTADTWRR